MVSTSAAGRGRFARRTLACSSFRPSASPGRAPGASRSPTPPRARGASVAVWGRDAAAMRRAGADAPQRAPARRRAGGRASASAPTRGLERLRRDPAGDSRAGDARGGRAASPRRCRAAAARRLRQGHRARRRPLHDRGLAEAAPGWPTRDPLRAELRRRRRRRPADRGDAGRAPTRRWRARFARRCSGPNLQALSFDRRARRRDRRRGQERAGDRLRRRGGARARRQRRRGADRARLRRAAGASARPSAPVRTR